MRTWFMSFMPSLIKCPTSKISALTIELLENVPWFLTEGLSSFSSYFKEKVPSWESKSEICAFLCTIKLGQVFMSLSQYLSCVQLHFIGLQPHFICLYFNNFVSWLWFRLLFGMLTTLYLENKTYSKKARGSERSQLKGGFFWNIAYFSGHSDHCSAVRMI